jgi:hypothetical protein
MPEKTILCHGMDGKPCGRLTEQECQALESTGKGRAVRSRKGALVRFMLNAMPENRVCIGWLGGSYTTKHVPIRDQEGVAITAPFFQHKPLIYSRPQG